MSDFGDPDGDRRVIRLGCLVIVFLAHDDLAHVYVKEGEILNNKWGSFHHNDIIGKSFGAHWKSRARGGGWVRCSDSFVSSALLQERSMA